MFRLPLLVFIAFSSSLFAQDTKTLEYKLKSDLAGNIRLIRDFHAGSELSYDAAGQLIGKIRTRPFTEAGFLVGKIELKKDRLRLSGNRAIQVWSEERTSLVFLKTNLPMEISIAFDPSNPDALMLALSKVFIQPNEAWYEQAPDYWQYFLSGDARKNGFKSKGQIENARLEAELAKKLAEVKAEKIPIEGGVIIGRRIDNVRPVYPEFAKSFGLQGSVKLAGKIAKDGTLKDLEILKPAGAGFDEAALEAAKKFRYTPYILKGEAVEVVTWLDINFTLEGAAKQKY